MTLKSLVWLAVAACSLPLGYGQDFSKSYTPTPGAQISIWANSSNFKVSGYKGSQVEIIAHKKGPDSKSIEIAEENNGNGWINLRVKDPNSTFGRFGPGGFNRWMIPRGGFHPPPQGAAPPPASGPPAPKMENENRVDFEIRLPKALESDNFLNLLWGNGTIEISNVNWRIHATNTNGDMVMKDSQGFIDLKSVFGAIRAELGSYKKFSEWIFVTNGEVQVSAPSNLNARVIMSSNLGRLKTDFKLEEKERRMGQPAKAEGTLGAGLQRLIATSLRGNVSLLKK